MDTEILTAQEHKLMGSTIKERHYAQPHKPLAVIDGNLTVEECDKLRIENPEITGLVAYFGVKGCFGKQRIFPLETNPQSENYGKSLEDPVLIATDNNDYLRDNRNEFPFPRQNPRSEIK